jgi:DNA-binding transcriptional LysR family regulator
MPHLLGVFLRNYPGVTPSLTITNQATVIQRLEENMDDLVIMGRIPDHLELQAAEFLENPLVVIAAVDHPLAGEKNIPLERIVEERFISREFGSGTREAVRRLLARHGLEIKPYMELGSGEAIKQAVMTGMGISVVSQHNLRLELEVGRIAMLDVQHFPLHREWYAVHLKGKQLSSAASHFLEFLLKDGERIWLSGA